jgi:uncharacterized protein
MQKKLRLMLPKALYSGAADNLYYWRDKTGNEIDVLIDKAGKLTAMELKAGETISQDFFKGIEYFSSLNAKAVEKILLYGGKQEQKRSNGIIVKTWSKLIGL